MASKQPGAVELLKEDHKKVKGLFKEFQSAKSENVKERIADEVDLELRVHSMIEEEILYPAMRDVDSDIVAESFEEHGVVEELLNELATMELSDDQFDAKFKVMLENVEHHIEEEETNMFPQASKLPNYEEIGLRLIERKMQLTKDLKAQGDASERATDGGLPSTMKASGKSETLAEGANPVPAKTDGGPKAAAPQTSTGNSRSRRATAAAGRSKK